MFIIIEVLNCFLSIPFSLLRYNLFGIHHTLPQPGPVHRHLDCAGVHLGARQCSTRTRWDDLLPRDPVTFEGGADVYLLCFCGKLQFASVAFNGFHI